MSEYYAWQDVEVMVDVVAGSSIVELDQFLHLGRGAVIELARNIEDPVELRVSGELIGRGEVEMVEGGLQVRILSMSGSERY